MPTVNIHHAKTHLSRLVDAAAGGEEIIIARAGRPVARLVALAADAPKRRVLGQLAHLGSKIPDDFDTMCADEIRDMFGGS